MKPDPLAQRLAGLRWPQPVADRPAPEPGQLWRATWAGSAAVVVVLAAPSRRQVLVAVGSHEPTGDDSTLVVSTEQGLSPTIWPRLSARIATFTLDLRLGDLTSDSVAALQRATEGELPGLWAPIAGDLDDRTLIAAELADRLDALASAEWLPSSGDGEPLRVLAARKGISPSMLARELGIAPGDARRLVQGARQATDDELAKMTVLLGARPGSGVTFDAELVERLDQPRVRPALQLFAVEHGLGDDEVAARRSLAGAVLAMAARHRGPGLGTGMP